MEGAGEARIVLPAPVPFCAEDGRTYDEVSRLLAQSGVVLRILIAAVGVGVLLWMAVRTARRPRGRAPTVASPRSLSL